MISNEKVPYKFMKVSKILQRFFIKSTKSKTINPI